jgi:hypothetical protein
VPAGLIDQEYGVCAGRDGGGDLHQGQVHRLGVAGRQDQGCTRSSSVVMVMIPAPFV